MITNVKREETFNPVRFTNITYMYCIKVSAEDFNTLHKYNLCLILAEKGSNCMWEKSNVTDNVSC